ncbi:hypothetical protein CLOSTMETH_03687 [[Clostridium] methylpentosum DSM 5476]|uniref:Uncharacterized protein n=1 Tax=[Clostridium] methylpentosum DSM 5476 TaxID=537013 RepID=C0EIJ1_9FIRM|nr:hypothetical protein CLOSTMETH_03687 [[Clostridium] methylpentosum DSM 5476]
MLDYAFLPNGLEIICKFIQTSLIFLFSSSQISKEVGKTTKNAFVL